MSKNDSKFNRFKYYSEQAAKNERDGALDDARDQWNIALLNAPGPKNREWCKRRAMFCERLISKPF